MKFHLILFFVLLCISINAQSPSWQDVTMRKEIGLKSMEVDSLGFLWAMSEEGIYKYDGFEMNEIFRADSKWNRFRHFYKTEDEVFLLGTETGQLVELNPYLSTIKFIEQTTDSVEISSFCHRDSNHYVLISYGNRAYIKWGQFEDALTTENGLVSDEIYDVKALDDRIYLATDQGLQILTIKDENYTSKILSKNEGLVDFIITTLEVIDGKVWFSDFDKSISYIDSIDLVHSFVFETSARINKIECNRNEVYVAREDGLYLLSGEQLQKIFPKSGSDKVSTLSFDEEDNIWLSSSTRPLVKGNSLFKKYQIQQSQIQTITKVDEKLIYGTKEGLYNYQDGVSTKISSENITCLSYDNKLLWVGTYASGIQLYNRNLKLITTSNSWKDVNGESILNIYHHNNTACVSSLTGIVEFEYDDKTNALKEVETLTSIVGQSYTYSLLSNNNKSYFGSDRQGITILDNDSEVKQDVKHFVDGSKIGSVYSLVADHLGTIWFSSTSGGLGYISKNEAHKVLNLPNVFDNYTSIISMSNENMMLIRRKSIDIFNPMTGIFSSFDNEFGTTDNPPFLNTYEVSESKVLFAHDNNIFEYNIPEAPKRHPEVLIDDMLVNLNETVESEFDEDENNVQFKFTGIWLTAPEKVNYQYKLKGFDNEWRNTKDRTVSFPKLDPGKYTFSVRASENDQFENIVPSTKSFSINRSFYNTTIFRLGFIFLLMLLLWKWRSYLEKQRSEKSLMEKQNIENQLINLQNQLNPHFLFNSFNTLVGLIEEDPERGVVFTEKMTDFFRSMLEFGKQELIRLSKEAELVDLYVDILKERFNNRFEVHKDIENYDFLIPPLTLQMLIENAVKHNAMTSDKPIIINIKQAGSELHISNNINPLVSKEKGTKTGLKNIEKRFYLNGLLKPEIKEGENTFLIVLKLKAI